jgi:hypothetical protein
MSIFLFTILIFPTLNSGTHDGCTVIHSNLSLYAAGGEII